MVTRTIKPVRNIQVHWLITKSALSVYTSPQRKEQRAEGRCRYDSHCRTALQYLLVYHCPLVRLHHSAPNKRLHIALPEDILSMFYFSPPKNALSPLGYRLSPPRRFAQGISST